MLRLINCLFVYLSVVFCIGVYLCSVCNRPTSQPVRCQSSQSVSQPVRCLAFRLPIGLSVCLSAFLSFLPVCPSFSQSITQTVSQPASQSVGQPAKDSVSPHFRTMFHSFPNVRYVYKLLEPPQYTH